MSRLGLVAIVLLLGPRPAVAAPAENLLANPEFVAGGIGWTACGSDTGVVGPDRAGCGDSDSVTTGAAQVDCGLGFPSPPYELTFGQCVPLAGTGIVAGSSKVSFSGWVFVDRNVTEGVALRYFTSADCSGTEISSTLVGGSGYGGSWAFWIVLNPVTVPAGTASIEYRAIGIDFDSNMFFYARLDDAYLGTRTRLFDEGFEHPSNVPCHWNAYSP